MTDGLGSVIYQYAQLSHLEAETRKEGESQTLGGLIDECFKDVPPEVMAGSHG